MRVSSASELKNSSSKVVAVQHWHEETTAATDSGESLKVLRCFLNLPGVRGGPRWVTEIEVLNMSGCLKAGPRRA